MQLIDLLYEDLTSCKIVFTESHPAPFWTNNGVITKRQDTKTAVEEAANMIVHQVADVKVREVPVVEDNTDIFVGLLHLCCQVIIPT